ncbi:hypothetical protein SBA1_90045 [Candidatus Sulfotelmatobacter kueseliae]|uniref:Uncharacterized protein n=1 Tax=Candidatus Sulfotelmatobacter kueseliae TaxID=2042962 RepID=A0A2U3LB06_9BACT|nr:hypothetical protein SBA1_90045 [Candidatus Sulfotelmatobacter kueseliae]
MFPGCLEPRRFCSTAASYGTAGLRVRPDTVASTTLSLDPVAAADATSGANVFAHLPTSLRGTRFVIEITC